MIFRTYVDIAAAASSQPDDVIPWQAWRWTHPNKVQVQNGMRIISHRLHESVTVMPEKAFHNRLNRISKSVSACRSISLALLRQPASAARLNRISRNQCKHVDQDNLLYCGSRRLQDATPRRPVRGGCGWVGFYK